MVRGWWSAISELCGIIYDIFLLWSGVRGPLSVNYLTSIWHQLVEHQLLVAIYENVLWKNSLLCFRKQTSKQHKTTRQENPFLPFHKTKQWCDERRHDTSPRMLISKNHPAPKREKPVVVTVLLGKCPCASALVGRRQLFHHPALVKDAGIIFWHHLFATQTSPTLSCEAHNIYADQRRSGQYTLRRCLGNAKQNVTATFMIPCAEHWNVHHSVRSNSWSLNFCVLPQFRLTESCEMVHSAKWKSRRTGKNLLFTTVLDVRRAEKRKGRAVELQNLVFHHNFVRTKWQICALPEFGCLTSTRWGEARADYVTKKGNKSLKRR